MGSEVLVGMAAVPLILAIVAYLRTFRQLADPQLATLLTLGVALAYHGFFKATGVAELVEVAWPTLVGQAVIVGLAASGLYSGTTAIIEARKAQPPTSSELGQFNIGGGLSTLAFVVVIVFILFLTERAELTNFID